MRKASTVIGLAFCIFSPLYSQETFPLKMLNSTYDEHHPVVSAKGQLYFTRAFHPSNMGGQGDPGDIWLADLSAFGEFLAPQVVESLSTKGYDLLIGFVNSSTALVYHGDLNNKQVIYEYNWVGNDWKRTEEVAIPGFRVNGEHFSARLNASGDVLLLSMDSFGSYGNEDIYVCIKSDDGSWSRPRNLGPQINSLHQELSPFLSKDGEVLYFSSNGHGAETGKSIFFSRKKGDSWTEWETAQPLQNLNSDGMELHYVEDMGTGRAYFTSTQNSEGYGDIFYVGAEILPEIKETNRGVAYTSPFPEQMTEELDDETMPENPVEETVTEIPPVLPEEEDETEKFSVVDRESLSPVSYEWLVTDASGQPTPFKEDFHTLKKLIEGGERFEEITITSPGYLPYSLDPQKKDEWPLEVGLTMMEEGANLSLDQINFKRGSAELEEGYSYRYIIRLASYLSEHPNIKILLEGHTDNFGSVRLNKELSINRAAAVRDLMVENGVDFERIRVNGWGGTKPIASNQTAEGRAKNRRVEMVIIEK
ncbi:OmpA family protein [Negadavirga shengliensis]|uniref:OmpA family protein n=1 Tax=Negadavirga shengliensis TaxID=1389218 RepID=A0ABV9SX60_9BACT